LHEGRNLTRTAAETRLNPGAPQADIMYLYIYVHTHGLTNSWIQREGSLHRCRNLTRTATATRRNPGVPPPNIIYLYIYVYTPRANRYLYTERG